MTDLEIARLCAEAMGYTIIRIERTWTDEYLRKNILPIINRLRVGESSAMIELDGELMFDKYGCKSDSICIEYTVYEPLHDDAQAMALVKKFGLWIIQPNQTQAMISVFKGDKKIGDAEDMISGRHQTDLNRAICECVAKMKRNRNDTRQIA